MSGKTNRGPTYGLARPTTELPVEAHAVSIEPLSGVSETLVIPVYARALETERPDGIIRDQKSVEVVRRLDYDFSKFGWMWAAQIGIAIRTEIIDRLAEEFMQAHTNVIAVNLGAGLCTRYYRLGNGDVKWFELDLPQVKTVRDRVLGESERHRFLIYSVMDFSWMERIKAEAAGRVLFIAEGLLMYFPETEVRALLAEMARNFPGSEMILETIGPMLAHSSRIHPLLSKTNAQFRWGIGDLRAIEGWSPAIHLAGQYRLFDYYPARWRFLRWLRRVPRLRQQMMIAHLRFAPATVSVGGYGAGGSGDRP